MYCILDIESSGGAFGKEAIIEIALYRYDGDKIVDQLISLVHPHVSVQPFVSRMTGITPKMLQRAPRFHEIAKRIVEITEGCILVGHNVPFDYRMLRQEFLRLGYPFELSTIDTIDLSKELIPGLQAYGLDKMCKELNITNTAKHRADGDALATLELFKILIEKDEKKEISILGQSVQREDHLTDKLNDLIRTIRIKKGVFYLHDQKGKLLYLSGSENVKNEIQKLFLADSPNMKKLQNEVYSIHVEKVGNQLIQEIKLFSELKESNPKYGSDFVLRPMSRMASLSRLESPYRFKIEDLNEEKKAKIILKSNNPAFLSKSIRMFNRDKQGQEAKIELFSNFPKEALVISKGRETSEKSVFYLKNDQLIGYTYFRLEDDITHLDSLLKKMPKLSKNTFADSVKLLILSGEARLIETKLSEQLIG